MHKGNIFTKQIPKEPKQTRIKQQNKNKIIKKKTNNGTFSMVTSSNIPSYHNYYHLSACLSLYLYLSLSLLAISRWLLMTPAPLCEHPIYKTHRFNLSQCVLLPRAPSASKHTHTFSGWHLSGGLRMQWPVLTVQAPDQNWAHFLIFTHHPSLSLSLSVRCLTSYTTHPQCLLWCFPAF